MGSRITGNRRIPRKIKKALKYAFLYPRVCGRYLRYGAVYTVGRNSKWLKEKQEPYKYVILDDDSDMLDTQSNNFIRTDWRAGLTEENVNKAIKILNG